MHVGFATCSTVLVACCVATARALVPSNTKLEQRIRSVEASLVLVEGGANKENARGVTNKANEGETCFRTLEAQASVSSPACVHASTAHALMRVHPDRAHWRHDS